VRVECKSNVLGSRCVRFTMHRNMGWLKYYELSPEGSVSILGSAWGILGCADKVAEVGDFPPSNGTYGSTDENSRIGY
jgi:hypothetical protein